MSRSSFSSSIRRSTWWVAVGAIAIVGSTSVATAGCGSKEEPKSKSSRSSSDDDDTSSTSRASGSSTYGGTAMGSSARRPSRPPRDLDSDDGPPRRRGDPDDDRRRSKSKGLLASLTDFVGDIVPKNPFSSSDGGSDIERAADEVCECKDKPCMDAVMKKFEKNGDKRKMDELSEDEKKHVERLVACVMRIEGDSKPTPRPTPPPSPDSGW